jgi:hypothetical protein
VNLGADVILSFAGRKSSVCLRHTGRDNAEGRNEKHALHAPRAQQRGDKPICADLSLFLLVDSDVDLDVDVDLDQDVLITGTSSKAS